MEDVEREKLAADALVKEIGRLQATVKEWFYPQEKLFAFGMALIVGGITLGLTKGNTIILTVVPTVLFVFYGHMLQVNVEMLSRAGHLRCLEEVANSQFGRHVFLDEVFVGPSRQGRSPFGRIGVVLFESFMGLVLLATTLLGWFAAASFATWVLCLYSFGAIFALSMLAMSVKELSTAYSRGYSAALKAQPFMPASVAVPFSPLISTSAIPDIGAPGKRPEGTFETCD